MNKDKITYVAIGLLAGIALTSIFASMSAKDSSKLKETATINADLKTLPASSTLDTEMSAMATGLQGKTGNDFDKAFLSEMILHHQGAVSMAQTALLNAKHQEIKDLSKAIISAQNSEITTMQSWQQKWY